MSTIVEEIRRAYAAVGITLDQPAAFGTYYRLLCAGCGRVLGQIGDKLLPGMGGDRERAARPLRVRPARLCVWPPAKAQRGESDMKRGAHDVAADNRATRRRPSVLPTTLKRSIDDPFVGPRTW